MHFQSSNIENLAIPLPITESSRRIARQFAITQPTKEKAEQVLLNTIAVKVVDNYLNMLGIATNLASSDSWNPIMQLCCNVADLNLPGIGTIECRPISNSDVSWQNPLDTWDLRIAYVVVRIEEGLKKAAILGFKSQVITEEFMPIADLQPIEVLLDHLHEIKKSAINNTITNLGQWLNDIVKPGWQQVETLLNREQLFPTYGFRNSEVLDADSSAEGGIKKAKLIDLGVPLEARNVVLLVDIIPEDNSNFAITLQVYPQGNQIYLPEGLKLKVFEASDAVFLESQARSHDNYIQLKFSGQAEEVFRVEVVLDDIKFSEDFKL